MEVKMVGNGKSAVKYSGLNKKMHLPEGMVKALPGWGRRDNNKIVVIGPDNRSMKLGQPVLGMNQGGALGIMGSGAVKISEDVIAVTSAKGKRQMIKRDLLNRKYAYEKTHGTVVVKETGR